MKYDRHFQVGDLAGALELVAKHVFGPVLRVLPDNRQLVIQLNGAETTLSIGSCLRYSHPPLLERCRGKERFRVGDEVVRVDGTPGAGIVIFVEPDDYHYSHSVFVAYGPGDARWYHEKELSKTPLQQLIDSGRTYREVQDVA